MSAPSTGIIRFLPAAVFFTVIAGLSFIPVGWVESVLTRMGVADVPNIDKILHFGFYCLLAGLINLLVHPEFRYNLSTTLLIAVGVTLLGVFVEFFQPFFGRPCSPGDMLANLSGASFYAVCYRIRRRFAPEPPLNEISLNFRSAKHVLDSRKKFPGAE